MTIRNVVNTTLLVVLGLWLFACESERRESEECMAARKNAHQSATQGVLGQAEAELKRAREECSKASDYDIERVQRLIERERRRQKLMAEQTTRRRQTESPVSSFMAWVASIREASDKNVGPTECVPRGDPKFGLCTSRITSGDAKFEVTFHRSETDAYRFSTTVAHPLTCADLGEHRVLRQWQDAEQRFLLCELAEHNLFGLKALLGAQTPTSTRVDVYSRSYLRQDAAFAKRVPD